MLSDAASAFADEKFPQARSLLLRAKKMSPRAEAVRELLGLAAYRMGEWEEALRELRTFRRVAGDTSHMPIEMDTLRALGRPGDVHKTYDRYRELGGRPATESEIRVVYGAFLLDEGEPRAAWDLTRPKKLAGNAAPHELRRWYVAARAAAALNDGATARKILAAIAESESEIPGMDELEIEVAAAESR